MKFSVKLQGLVEIEQRLDALRASTVLHKEAAAGIFADANQIMNASQRICPVLTGNLRATGHVRVPVIRGDRVDCEFGYGGPAAPYAFYVHENLRAHHNNGSAKYLEIPYLAYVSGGLTQFTDRLRAASIFGHSLRSIGRSL